MGNGRLAAGGSYHADLVRRTQAAIEDLRESGGRVSFYSVAERARVARSTLYRCGDLRRLVEGARAARAPADRAETADLARELARVRSERDALARIVEADRPYRYAFIGIEAA